MSGSRAQLGADLGAQLVVEDVKPFKVITDPRTLERLDPSCRGTLQIVRSRVKPNPTAPLAQNSEQLHVWVITHQLEQPAAEDDLDELLDEVLAAFVRLGSAGEPDAERRTHPDGHHAYRITVTYDTDTKE